MFLLRAPRNLLSGLRRSAVLSRYHNERLLSTSVPNVKKSGVELKEGSELHGYTVLRVSEVPEFSLTAYLLKHNLTKAQHLHISRDDSNNVFGVSFRTTPRDSTGVPHILEHLSLCGSERFPVRDPFFKMLTRSLSTFMNAFTASDWTMYPFSTQNLQDYNNLMSVYLDAAFFPKLLEEDFRQEGWRLEHEKVDDPTSPLIFKGVVFNEMKGAFSNSDQLFGTRNQNLLLPSHTYGVVSGGDPAYIPDLTWAQLREFHKKHYHPSNSRFYTYGNFPLEQHLKRISEQCLNKFKSENVDTGVKLEPRWDKPRESHISCAPDPMSPDPDKSVTMAMTYLLCKITDVDEACALSILCSLLTDGEKSPFYQSLIESGLGSDYAPTTGLHPKQEAADSNPIMVACYGKKWYNGYTQESSFSVGLQRISANDVNKVKEIIEKTFDDVIKNGFEKERIEAILHKIELSVKHQSDKFGLNLGISILPGWTHEGDPTELIQVNTQVENFKKKLAQNPQYLQDLVKKYFKENNHRLTLVMKPEQDFSSKREENEKSRLSHLLSQLNDADKKSLFDKGLELSKAQSQTPDVSCLPTLLVKDIERNIEKVNLHKIISKGVPIQLCEQPTNGITYFRGVVSLEKVPDHLKQYVPLFCNIVTRMGAGGLDYKDLSERIELKTGGLSASVHLATNPNDVNLFEQSVLFSSHCLDHNIEEMFNLWSLIFSSLDLGDVDHLRTLILMSAAEVSAGLSDSGHRYAMTHASSSISPAAALKELMSGVTQISAGLSDSGHRYAMTHASSSISPAAALKELMSGVTQVETLKKLSDNTDIESIVQDMKTLASIILNPSNVRCSLNTTADTSQVAFKSAETFLSSFNSPDHATGHDISRFYTKSESFKRSPTLLHYELPFQVHYVGKAVATVPYTHPDFARLRVLAKMMSSRFLHREIREKGGAYGGGALSDAGGLFHFFSYRDPGLEKTLDAFEGSVRWVTSGDFKQQDIDESKLGVFSEVDSPVPPGDKGVREFLTGVDDVTFHQQRHRLLDVNKNDLIDVARRYLDAEVSKKNSSVTVIGPAQSTGPLNGWTIKKPN